MIWLALLLVPLVLTGCPRGRLELTCVGTPVQQLGVLMMKCADEDTWKEISKE